MLAVIVRTVGTAIVETAGCVSFQYWGLHTLFL